MPGNQGGSNWGSTAANPADGSVYVIGFNVPTLIRLLKPGETRPGARRRTAGSGEGRALRDRRLRAVSDDRQSAVHDADRVRSEQRHDQVADRARRRSAPRRPGRSKARARRRRSRAGSSRPPRACCSSPRRIARSTSTTAPPASRCGNCRSAAPTSGSPSMYELGGRQYLLVTATPAGGPGAPAGAPSGIVAYALPRQ